MKKHTMIDGKEYAKQMRVNAVTDNNGNIIVSKELWQQIANVIEEQQAEIERLTDKNKRLGEGVGWLLNNENGSDDISNLMPACRMCNHYKRANPLELFRKYIQEIPIKLRQNYIYKVGVAYGNIIENEKPIVFYFEKAGADE